MTARKIVWCMVTAAVGMLFLVFVCFSATLFRDGNTDTKGTDYGMLPTNAPSAGDILMVTKNGTSWVSLTNIVTGIIAEKLKKL